MGSSLVAQGLSDLTPWDALLLEVRRSAYRVEWIDRRVQSTLQDFRQLEHESDRGDAEYQAAMKELRSWMTESRRERNHLARVAKASIDAGIASTLVQQAELDGQRMAEIFERALDLAGFDDDDRLRATQALRDVLAGNAPAATLGEGETLDGELVNDDDNDDGDDGDDGDEPPTLRNPGEFL